MMITISGRPGSGKTTTAKILAQRLGYQFYSVGDLRGEIASKMGLTIDQLNEIGKKEDWTDKTVDRKTEEIGKREDNIVFDSWMAWHFIPHSFKIFLEVGPMVAAERVFKNQRPDEKHQETVEDVAEMLKIRMEESRQRYKKYYNIDFLDKSRYDLIIDTTNLMPDEAVNKIVNEIVKYEKRLQVQMATNL
jgi:cytidylate kinase